MLTQRLPKPLVTTLTVIAMLVVTMTTMAAAPSQESGEPSGVFGEVIVVDGDVLNVRTKEGDIQIQVTLDTQVRSPENQHDSLDPIAPGDRIAVLVVSQGGLQLAQVAMVIPQQGSVAHFIGVMTEVTEGTASIITEDGRRVPVEFGLKRTIPAPGTVVTIVGNTDPDTGIVRTRSLQRLDETLQRLGNHLEEIQDIVPDRESQIHHLARLQRLLEDSSERQLEILNEAVQFLPEEARPALERALHNLDEANKAVTQAFSQALELASEPGRRDGRLQGPPGVTLPVEIEPSLEDVARVLGISEDALTERLSQGLTLVQITAGGRLPARYVIHTVGPVWGGGSSGEAETLASAYRESLKLASLHGLKRVTFPSISTGAYGYPLEGAAEVALGTLLAFLREGSPSVEEITVVLYSTGAMQVYSLTLQRLLGHSS